MLHKNFRKVPTIKAEVGKSVMFATFLKIIIYSIKKGA